MPQGSAELIAEANWICPLIEKNAPAFRAAQLGRHFRLGAGSFRLYARARNTIYRVSGAFDWFLKMTREGNVGPMEHERLGVDAIGGALDPHPAYIGAAVTRVSTDFAYVLAASIPGRPLNRLFLSECWTPGARAATRLEESFRTLGILLAVLHRDVRTTPGMASATTRPFEALDGLLGRLQGSDAVTSVIVSWQNHHRQSDEGTTFQHGNFRLDNILRVDDRLGFIDFENCGTGSLYQDLSRPVSELILTRSAMVFPHARVTRCIMAFLQAYGSIRPIAVPALWEHVGVRVARYYLETRARQFKARIGGIPVVKGRLDRLALAVLHDDIEAVVPGLRG